MIRNRFNFVLCLALAVLLCIFVSGLGGMFIIILLCLSLFFSIILMLVSKKTLSIGLKLSSDISGKDEKLELELSVSKSTIMPTSFIEVTLEMTPNVSTEHLTSFKIICARRYGDVITIPVKTELCGEGTIRLADIKLVDYMGVMSCRPVLSQTGSYSASVRIMPQIRDVGVQNEVLRSASENAAANEDDEDESNESAIGLTGIAGYEHRKYELGDPLKRVNWKLSSKRDELMVRLDDKVLTSTQDFLLDYPVCENVSKQYYENADRIIEASLSMLSMLLMQGYESSYTYYLDGWHTLEVSDEKGLILLQEELAGIRPVPAGERMKMTESAGSTVICFTTCLGYMTRELALLSELKDCSLVVSEESGIGKICNKVWKVNHDFEFISL